MNRHVWQIIPGLPVWKCFHCHMRARRNDHGRIFDVRLFGDEHWTPINRISDWPCVPKGEKR